MRCKFSGAHLSCEMPESVIGMQMGTRLLMRVLLRCMKIDMQSRRMPRAPV